MASLETRLESEHSQDISQASKFSSEEEIWTPKIRTEAQAYSFGETNFPEPELED